MDLDLNGSPFPAVDDADATIAPSKESCWIPETLGATSSVETAQTLPASIGRYRILRLLGAGGMGIVYEAEQESPRRTVALKVVKPGFANPELRHRFEQEFAALGRLHHSGIAQIYEAGAADAGWDLQPYFAMELVRGRPLLEYAGAHLNTRQRLELMLKICEAVDHAHRHGIIHRDLKPGNILVEETGQPKILDFGVARATDSDARATRQTDVGQIVGTLAYMSPEQALGDPLELDVRSDVYALGVICYELLAGRLPYDVGKKLHEAVLTIRERDPAPLGSIDRIYRGDVETIVAKALEKDKERRYASAAELAADIRRYLADEPILARPASTAYQLQKFARRQKALVTGVAAVFVVLAGGIVASTWQAARATRERDRATAAEQRANQERDRASTAEQGATKQRDAALRAQQATSEAETQAVRERNRAVAEKQRADTEAATAKAEIDFLENDLLAQASPARQAGPNSKPDPDLKVRTALDRAAARLAGRFEAQSLVEASLRQTIGSTYLDLGLYPEAQREMERAIELRRRELGEEDPATLNSLYSLANVLHAQGKYAQAEALHARILEVRRRRLGEGHRDTLASMNSLISIYRDETKNEQAAALVAKALETQRRVLGEEHPETLRTLLNLAALNRNQGKYPQAEELFKKVLEIQRRTLGEEHPDTLSTLELVALQYRYEGKYPESEAIYAQSLEIKRRVLGKEHPETLQTMNLLAVLRRVNGKYAQAEELLTEALQTERRTLGEEHPLTVLSMAELPGVYWVEGKYAEAEPLYIKVVDIRRRLMGEEQADTMSSMNNLATLYLSEGKFSQAEPLLTRVLEVRRRRTSEDHPLTLLSMNNLAILYRHQGKYAQAETLFTKVLEGRRRVLGEDSPDTLKTIDALGGLYRVEGRYLDAEPLLTEAVDGRRRVLGEQNPDTLVSMNSMALLLLDQRNYAQAEVLFSQVLEARRRVLGLDHPDTTSVLDSLARIRLQQQRYAEAEPVLREALAVQEKKNRDSWERYDSQSMLGACLEGQGQYGGAEPLLVAGYEGLANRESTIPWPNRSALDLAGQRIVQLYRNWGKPEKAAAWQEKLKVAQAGVPKKP
jgi:tetratricopeptide (TPR) repeat protein